LGGARSIDIGNNVLTNTEPSSQWNAAVGSYNLQNLTTGQYNTSIGQGLLGNLTTGGSSVALGYEASSSYESKWAATILLLATFLEGGQ